MSIVAKRDDSCVKKSVRCLFGRILAAIEPIGVEAEFSRLPSLFRRCWAKSGTSCSIPGRLSSKLGEGPNSATEDGRNHDAWVDKRPRQEGSSRAALSSRELAQRTVRSPKVEVPVPVGGPRGGRVWSRLVDMFATKWVRAITRRVVKKGPLLPTPLDVSRRPEFREKTENAKRKPVGTHSFGVRPEST